MGMLPRPDGVASCVVSCKPGFASPLVDNLGRVFAFGDMPISNEVRMCVCG